MLVLLPLDEIQRLRDRLNRVKHKDREARVLFEQLVALYARCARAAFPEAKAAGLPRP